MGKKTKYKRSTPVRRLRRNVAKVARHAGLVQARLTSWGPVTEPKVSSVKALVVEILAKAAAIDALLKDLERRNFVVPKRSSAIFFEVGQRAKIGPKYRAKYRAVYAKVLETVPGLLDDLVVTSILLSGEVVVRCGQRTPFMVPKSHLVKLPART